MIINVKKEDVFIPAWDGNRDKPDKEQVKIYHTYLSTAGRERFVYVKNYTEGQAQRLMALADDPQFSLDKYVEANDREIVQDGKGIALAVVTKIENLGYTYGDDKVIEIDTIQKFYDAPDAFGSLRAEIEAYCLTLSARADTKN